MFTAFTHSHIGSRLAALFTVLLLTGVGALMVAENALDRHVELAQLVAQTGRLRMLSQSLAHGAHQYARGTPTAPREMERLIGEFEASLRSVDETIDALGNAGNGLPAGLREQSRRYLDSVRRLLRHGNDREQQAGLLDAVDAEAKRTLAEEEAAVGALLLRHAELRQRLHLELAVILLLALGLTVFAYWRIRARIVAPVHRLAGAARRFAAGDHDVQASHDAADEIGDLVRTFNDSAATIRELIAHRSQDKLAIQDGEQRHRALWETASDAIIIMGADHVIRHANPAVAAIFGYAPAELIGCNISALQPAHLRQTELWGLKIALARGATSALDHATETLVRHKSGGEIPVEVALTPLHLSDAELIAAFFHDVSQRSEAISALRLRERAMQSAGEGIMISDAVAADHPTLQVNRAFSRITGYEEADVVGRNVRFLLGDEGEQPGAEALRHLLRQRQDGTVALRCRRKDGSAFWTELSVSPVRDEQGIATHTISIFKDITERRQQEEELLRNAHRDTLTGLANRALLNDRIAQAIAVAQRHDRRVGVLVVDVDNFKLINDSLGHEVGDLLLKETAQRLTICLREGDTAARLSGDEFVLLLSDMENEDDVAFVAERVLSSMVRPFRHAGGEFFVSASIGASFYPRDGADGATLLKYADIAMYRAKEHGRNNFQVFMEEMQARIDHRLTLETHLRRALERGEFALHYQPQVSLASGRIVGAEALIRWRHEEMGMVPPARFIPLAEETGLIVPIGEWVLDAACAQMAAWREDRLPPLGVAVNLSARQFRQDNLAQIIENSLRRHGIAAEHLELEITESMLMHDPEQTIGLLNQLKAAGLRVSLDDFGTGYSSLSHLQRLPIDILKIDQSFVREIGTSRDAAAIVATIVGLAHGLELTVVAEGVETREQLRHLAQLRCHVFQGYYFAKPVPAPEFAVMLALGKRLDAAELAAD